MPGRYNEKVLEGGRRVGKVNFIQGGNRYIILVSKLYYYSINNPTIDGSTTLDPRSTTLLIKEDQHIIRLVARFGTKKWPLISERLCAETAFERTGKQCRQRYWDANSGGTTISTPRSPLPCGAKRTKNASSLLISNTETSGKSFPSYLLAGKPCSIPELTTRSRIIFTRQFADACAGSTSFRARKTAHSK